MSLARNRPVLGCRSGIMKNIWSRILIDHLRFWVGIAGVGVFLSPQMIYDNLEWLCDTNAVAYDLLGPVLSSDVFDMLLRCLQVGGGLIVFAAIYFPGTLRRSNKSAGNTSRHD